MNLCTKISNLERGPKALITMVILIILGFILFFLGVEIGESLYKAINP